jgi:uncharacterized radical SAM superfamily Fe-S cluster-containing enzyme
LWSSSAQVGSDNAARDVMNTLTGEQPGFVMPDAPLSVEEQTSFSRTSERCVACHSHLPLSAHAPRDLARHIFMVNTRDFMDPWTFSVKNAMKCCVEFLIPDGRAIPFCTYNSVGYRERMTRAC